MGWFGPKDTTSTISGHKSKSKESDRDDDEDYDDEEEEEEEEEEEDEDDGDYMDNPKKTCAFQNNYGAYDYDEMYPGESEEGWDCDLTTNNIRCRKEICPLWKNVNGTWKTNHPRDD